MVYFMCQKILISGNIKSGVLDNLDVENWEELVEFNEFAVQKAEQIQMFSLGMLILFIFLLFQSIYILSKRNWIDLEILKLYRNLQSKSVLKHLNLLY